MVSLRIQIDRMMPHQVSKVTIVALIGVAALIAAGRLVAWVPTGSTLVSSSVTTSTGFVYLLSAVGACRGPAGYAPCFGGDITEAEIFNCARAATSPAGCTQLVENPSNTSISYQVTVWYPYLAYANEPSWANCRYQSTGDPGRQYFANCISTNSTAFIVSEPAPPPA